LDLPCQESRFKNQESRSSQLKITSIYVVLMRYSVNIITNQTYILICFTSAYHYSPKSKTGELNFQMENFNLKLQVGIIFLLEASSSNNYISTILSSDLASFARKLSPKHCYYHEILIYGRIFIGKFSHLWDLCHIHPELLNSGAICICRNCAAISGDY
jgi:hypothetical protein